MNCPNCDSPLMVRHAAVCTVEHTRKAEVRRFGKELIIECHFCGLSRGGFQPDLPGRIHIIQK